MGALNELKRFFAPSLSRSERTSRARKSRKDSNDEGIAIIGARGMATRQPTASSASPAASSPGTEDSTVALVSSRVRSAAMRGRAKSSEQDGADKGSMRSLQTPLSIIKVSPLSLLLNHHNKVGSSFLNAQPNIYRSNSDTNASNGRTSSNTNGLTDNQQAALLAAAAAAAATTATATDGGSNQARLLPTATRKARDSGALLFMLTFLGFLGYIIWDSVFIKEADLNLIIHGYDSFGNICGRNNKPIKFADKSGQNYTGRPFTKYTLINSQFERYTIDSSRLKNGELVYVKELSDENWLERQRNNDSSFERWPSATMSSSAQRHALATSGSVLSPREPKESSSQRVVFSTDVDGNKLNAVQRQQHMRTTLGPLQRGSSNAVRFVRQAAVATAAAKVAAPQRTAPPNLFAELARAQHNKNRTLLSEIKSDLMYQYPPMYGYSSERTTAASVAKSVVSSARGSVDSPDATRRVASDSELADNDDQTDARESDAAHVQQQFKHRPMLDERDHVQIAKLRPPAASNLNETGDRYDHMFVTPISVLTNSFASGHQSHDSPPFLSSSEVSSHLLYLTECVSSCPRDHVELIFYRCMPKSWRFSLFPNAINVTRTFIDDIVTDISHCYKELIYTFSLALVLSLGLLILLRFLASIIIWSCIFALLSLFLSMASYSWLTFYYQILDLNQMMPHDPAYNEKLATSDKWLIGSIFLTFVAFAAIGVILFMRKRILLVTMLFRESGKAIADMPLLLLQPLLTFAVLVGIMITWSIGLICLQSMKKPVIDLTTGFVVFRAETLYKIMKWYHVFAFLWVSHFAIACQHYVIGASVTKWYFSSNRYALSSPIGTSISELILYYMGSVALGSFLVAIFKVIRIITRQIQFLVQRNCMSSTANGVSQSASGQAVTIAPQTNSSCCGSFSYIWRLSLWFIDNIVMIINRDAYVEIAIHGHSFLTGARRAFTILASNPLRLLAIKSVGNLLLIIAKICVVFATISVAYVLLEEKKHTLNYAWSPIVASAIYAYIVAHWFLSVYEMVIDALFICYCEDYELTKSQTEMVRQIRGSNFMSHILATDEMGRTIYH